MLDGQDDFGDRMKGYERAETDRRLDATLPIYARIDGRSFSSFTRDMQRPFDERMSAAMAATTMKLVEATHARIGYTQSDEISLVWLFDQESQPLFGGKVHKLTSVLASLAAAAFAQAVSRAWEPDRATELLNRLPHFDARVLSVPNKTEAANAILWRVMDAKKNAVSMAARAHYSAKALHGKDQTAMREMLAAKGIDFERYPDWFRMGTFWRRETAARVLTGDELARIPEKHRPTGPVMRSSVVEVVMPDYFHKIANRAGVVFDGERPEVNR